MTEAQGPDPDTLRRALHPRYVLERPLGRGGMGVVYLATDVRLDRPVAIKVLPPSHASQSTARARFLREARTAARLSHPNIVPIHAVDEWDDLVYYAMAYVEGETLEQRVRRLGPLAPLDAARVLRDVAWALAYAHARGVIHRDIKPDNILFDAGTGRAMVTDFGIAWVDSRKTNTGPNELFGTPEFMSPEQARGRPVDGRSDTYSLGVVGFYALTGRVPFGDRDPQRVMMLQVRAPAPCVAQEVPGIPDRLARAVDRCLAKRPEGRFQRAEDLSTDMTRLLEEHSAGPLAVRAFVTDSKLLLVPARLYAVFLVGVLLPLTLLGLTWGMAPMAPWVLVGGTAVGVVAPLGFMLWRVRKFLVTGHTREDLVDLLQVELSRQLEEMAFTYGGRPTRMERGLRAVAYAALVACALSVAVAGHDLGSVPDFTPWLVTVTAAAVALLAAVVARLRTEHRTDPGAGRRVAFWRGRPGQWLFRLAAVGRPRTPPASGSEPGRSPRVTGLTPTPTPAPNA